MAMRYIGGHKRRYRLIDFARERDGVAAVVKTMSTIPTVRHALRWLYIPMARNAIITRWPPGRSDHYVRHRSCP